MSKIRMAAAAATIACSLLLVGGTGVASAQDAPHLAKKVHVTGTKGFKGTYTIDRFIKKGNQIYAVGKLVGKTRGAKKVTKRGVRMPATLGSGAQAAQILPTPGACSILNLQLGPIDLNLLGLRVRTNQINLLIEAVPGAGNLLGNLLCGITGILNPTLANTPLGQLTQILNALLALSPRTA
ncbi:MAG TPA: hypothetical protein VFG79_00600 [Solirubrobacter sp.]|nr:hypothetical protein [Solirubrobacter sp.]